MQRKVLNTLTSAPRSFPSEYVQYEMLESMFDMASSVLPVLLEYRLVGIRFPGVSLVVTEELEPWRI